MCNLGILRSVMPCILNKHIRSLEEKNMSIDIIDGLLKQWYKVWTKIKSSVGNRG